MDYILCHVLISWILNKLNEGIRAIIISSNPSILPTTNETYIEKLIWNAIISSNAIIFALRSSDASCIMQESPSKVIAQVLCSAKIVRRKKKLYFLNNNAKL